MAKGAVIMANMVTSFIGALFSTNKVNHKRVRRQHQAPSNAYDSCHDHTKNMATVTEVIRETENAVTLVFNTRLPIDYRPGQFIHCHFYADGELESRSYSFSGIRSDGQHQITIKETSDGYVSKLINQTFREGMLFQVSNVGGNISPTLLTSTYEKLVLFAGGSGITPLKALAEYALEETSKPVVIVYSNRTHDDIIFFDQLEALNEKYANLTLVHVLDKASSKIGSQGPMNRAVAEQYELLGSNNLFVTCGPGGYINAVSNLLDGADISASSRHIEVFTSVNIPSVPLPPMAKTSNGYTASDDKAKRVEIRDTGESFVVKPNHTILGSAAGVGINLKHSCQAGGCGECKMKLISGQVRHQEPNCLTESERADGFVLTCVGVPTMDVVLESTTSSVH
ncbi:flavin reductase family protein [Veronia nyctiphanis]|nr:2Fe-2S iron-sulfur cluster-binding protein [Veronia nyctiphanis]